jgi:hypothetical protein
MLVHAQVDGDHKLCTDGVDRLVPVERELDGTEGPDVDDVLGHVVADVVEAQAHRFREQEQPRLDGRVPRRRFGVFDDRSPDGGLFLLRWAALPQIAVEVHGSHDEGDGDHDDGQGNHSTLVALHPLESS